MNIYFDTEFESLQKDTNLISIGLVSEDGKEFYAEFKGINPKKQSTWIQENVLQHTVEYGDTQVLDIVSDENNYYVGTKEDIKYLLQDWLAQFDNIQLISDVCHYDMVLFIDIFGTAFDIPDNMCPCCYDINMDIAKENGISLEDAFDINRETLIDTTRLPSTKHNSMYDARVIKEIYTKLMK